MYEVQAQHPTTAISSAASGMNVVANEIPNSNPTSQLLSAGICVRTRTVLIYQLKLIGL